jgi:hypothetical protein
MPAGDDSGVRTTMAYGTSAVVVRSTHRACGARRRCDGAPALRMRSTIGAADAIRRRTGPVAPPAHANAGSARACRNAQRIGVFITTLPLTACAESSTALTFQPARAARAPHLPHSMGTSGKGTRLA